jgi:anti-sigma regulatory factor (Ser/Thr protein kinase)
MPPNPRFSRSVRQRLGAFARHHGVGEEDLRLFLTAVGEGLANAIEHSHSSRPVEVVCGVGDDMIAATITDGGVGFETAVPQIELPPDDSEHGRGLSIMRDCSDIFAIRSRPGQGTAVTVGRFLSRHGRNRRDRDCGEGLGATG